MFPKIPYSSNERDTGRTTSEGISTDLQKPTKKRSSALGSIQREMSNATDRDVITKELSKENERLKQKISKLQKLNRSGD